MDELKRRAALPGGSYPFQLVSNSLEYAPSKTLAYEFCLAVSRAATLTEGEHVRLPRNFERLSAIVARLYLGSGAEAVRIGWPSDNEDPAPHPKTFIDRIALLRARSTPGSGEWELEPEEGFESSADNAKDHGMDFVAWKSFPDQRIGRLTIIGQCACGKNDQGDDRKAQELNFDSVKLLLRRLTWPNPIRAFASPFHVPEPERFKALHALPNLVFDRARIAAVCEGEPNDSVLAEMRPRLAELISLAVERFKLAKPRRRGKRSRQ
ncbi:MAG TPA: hypothetical protein VK324_16185 [Tepidisphaeraceae bacterium]|nr:hypothetical protein [Tepidisphaeraceae bacterium]